MNRPAQTAPWSVPEKALLSTPSLSTGFQLTQATILQEGHNANIALVRFISEIYQYNDFERGTTVNPGIIEGGKIVNAIPDLARVEIDTRFWKDEDGRWLDQKIQEAAKKVWVEGVTCELKRNSFLPAMPLSDATKELVGIVNQAAEKAGFTAEWSMRAAARTETTSRKAEFPWWMAAVLPDRDSTLSVNICSLIRWKNVSECRRMFTR